MRVGPAKVNPSTRPVKVPITRRRSTIVGAVSVVPPSAVRKTRAPVRASNPSRVGVPLTVIQTVSPLIVGEPFSVLVPSGLLQATAALQSAAIVIRTSWVPVAV